MSAPSESDGIRPGVDVVVPFAGTQFELQELVERLAGLALGGQDSLTVVDNRPPGSRPVPSPSPAVAVIRASHRRSSYYARNCGAAAGSAEWVLFIDADVEPPAHLLDLYFVHAPGERTAVLAGEVADERLDPAIERSLGGRYAMLQARMSQRNTLRNGRWSYAQTANCAVRREAFEQVGGFRDDVRSGGDADLCYRLKRAGWEIELRDEAAVVHRTRRTLREMLRQRVRHGAGAAWLNREYPGSFPPRRLLGLGKLTVQGLMRAPTEAVRGRGDDAIRAIAEPLEYWAVEVGRRLPNTVRDRGGA